MPQIATPVHSSLVRWTSWLAVLSVITGMLALLGVILPGPLYRLGVYGLGAAFGMLTAGYCGAISAALLGFSGLMLVLPARRPKYLAGLCMLGMLFGVLAGGISYSLWLKWAWSEPSIHDISTDTVNPPQFEPDVLALRKGSQNPAIYAGAVLASQQSKAYPDIQPMKFNLPATAVYAAALRTVETLGWRLDSNDPVTGIIEATSTTFWFGLKDDVVIRIHATGGSTRLDIRSVSRAGKGDMGKNGQLIRAFQTALYRQLGLQSLERH
jgi:uncharacterized protein (DUF1499 family)